MSPSGGKGELDMNPRNVLTGPWHDKNQIMPPPGMKHVSEDPQYKPYEASSETFTHLHRQHVPPAYMTSADVKYSGGHLSPKQTYNDPDMTTPRKESPSLSRSPSLGEFLSQAKQKRADRLQNLRSTLENSPSNSVLATKNLRIQRRQTESVLYTPPPLTKNQNDYHKRQLVGEAVKLPPIQTRKE